MRAKFRLQSVRQNMGEDGSVRSVEVYGTPVVGDSEDNKAWSRATPSGELKLLITNPAAFDTFRPSHEFYVDITPVV